MDLWIRSQDGKNLVAIDGRLSITRVPTEKHNVEDGYRIEHFSFLLGIYKTEKRALEVLDEIQKTIINNEVIRIIMPNVKDMRGNEELYKENVFNTMVYEMPKE